MTRPFFVLVLLAANAASFGQTWNVFGADDRVALTSTRYPWRTIGKIDSGCTATLVGKNLALTAAHCVLEGGSLRYIGNFRPNYIDGMSADSSWVKRVWWGTRYPDSNRGDDWAILQLDDNLGDTYGWMGVASESRTYVTMAGYSGDFKGGQTAGVHVDCRFRDTLGSFWLHDCDTSRGSSGGPMFYLNGDSATIVAINVAERRNGGDSSLFLDWYETDHANIAVPASAFLSKLRELKGE